MKIKLYTYPTLLLFLILVFSCQSKVQPESQVGEGIVASASDCIDQILAADDELGSIRNHACEKIDLAETIQDYIKGLASLDYSNCPEKFTAAFDRHRKAWEAMLPLVGKYPDLRGEMHDLFDELEAGEDAETFKPLLKGIWDTWKEVEDAKKEAGK